VQEPRLARPSPPKLRDAASYIVAVCQHAMRTSGASPEPRRESVNQTVDVDHFPRLVRRMQHVEKEGLPIWNRSQRHITKNVLGAVLG